MAASEDVRRGVRYAFGRGLDPRAKDGVRAHPWVFVAGMLLHLGVAAALASVAMAVRAIAPPVWLRWPLVLLNAAGAAAGMFLLVRRIREPVLRVISGPDDYVSNLLVVSLLAAAFASLLDPRMSTPLAVVFVALVAYAPLGKIRHCVLFFVTRARFGAFIGARGALVGRTRR